MEERPISKRIFDEIGYNVSGFVKKHIESLDKISKNSEKSAQSREGDILRGEVKELKEELRKANLEIEELRKKAAYSARDENRLESEE